MDRAAEFGPCDPSLIPLGETKEKKLNFLKVVISNKNDLGIGGKNQ